MNEATHISHVRLFNAIKDAVNEMDRCSKDSIEDIWNEMLDKWETGLRMDRKYNIEPNTERSACGTPSAESDCSACFGRGFTYGPTNAYPITEAQEEPERIDCTSCKGTGEKPNKEIRQKEDGRQEDGR